MSDTPLPMPVTPGDQPQLRLSDREREAVAAFLRHHADEGRLSLVELEDRLSVVYGARVRADLDGVAEGLPLEVVRPPSAPRPLPATSQRELSRQRHRTGGAAEKSLAIHVRTYFVFCVFFVLIWAFSGGGYFWPIWPMLGWGVGVASHWAASAGKR